MRGRRRAEGGGRKCGTEPSVGVPPSALRPPPSALVTLTLECMTDHDEVERAFPGYRRLADQALMDAAKQAQAEQARTGVRG